MTNRSSMATFTSALHTRRGVAFEQRPGLACRAWPSRCWRREPNLETWRQCFFRHSSQSPIDVGCATRLLCATNLPGVDR